MIYSFINMNNIIRVVIYLNFIFKIPINFRTSSFPSCFFVTFSSMFL